MANLGTIERRPGLSPEELVEGYVKKRQPVLVPDALSACPALANWTLDYLRCRAGHRQVRLKGGYLPDLVTSHTSLTDYLDSIEIYEEKVREGVASPEERPAYLHDVPLVSVIEDALSDLVPFPAAYFPEWYRKDWWRFAQFFLGPSHSVTPLHFDTLVSHNLFFQVMGRKRFILLPYGQREYCYREGWRWFEVDPENPDLERHPLFWKAGPMECIVEPGAMLYLPPGMLHHVRSLDCAVSFNVDWHTPDSALAGIGALHEGMPMKNVYYNALIALGLCAGVPARTILPFYKSYLNYMS